MRLFRLGEKVICVTEYKKTTFSKGTNNVGLFLSLGILGNYYLVFGSALSMHRQTNGAIGCL